MRQMRNMFWIAAMVLPLAAFGASAGAPTTTLTTTTTNETDPTVPAACELATSLELGDEPDGIAPPLSCKTLCPRCEAAGGVCEPAPNGGCFCS